MKDHTRKQPLKNKEHYSRRNRGTKKTGKSVSLPPSKGFYFKAIDSILEFYSVFKIVLAISSVVLVERVLNCLWFILGLRFEGVSQMSPDLKVVKIKGAAVV